MDELDPLGLFSDPNADPLGIGIPAFTGSTSATPPPTELPDLPQETPSVSDEVSERIMQNLQGLASLPVHVIKAMANPMAAIQGAAQGIIDDPVGAGRTATTIGATAATVPLAISSGGASLPLSVVAGPTAGTAYDLFMQRMGVTEPKSKNEMIGEYVGDITTDAGITALTGGLGKTRQALTPTSSLRANVNDPSVRAAVNVAENMQTVTPKEAAKFAQGRITPGLEDAISLSNRRAKDLRGIGDLLAQPHHASDKNVRNALIFKKEAKKLAPYLKAKPNETFEAYRNRIVLTQEKAAGARTSALAKLDNVVARSPEKGIQVEDINKIVQRAEARLAKMPEGQLLEQGMALREQIDQIKTLVDYGDDAPKILDAAGNPYIPAPKLKTPISFQKLSDQIVEINNKRRELKTFDAATQAARREGTPSRGVTRRHERAALFEIQTELRDLLASKAKAINPRALGQYKKANKQYGDIAPLRDSLDSFEGIMSHGATKKSEAAFVRPGIEKNMVADSLSPSPATTGFRLLNRMLTRDVPRQQGIREAHTRAYQSVDELPQALSDLELLSRKPAQVMRDAKPSPMDFMTRAAPPALMARSLESGFLEYESISRNARRVDPLMINKVLESIPEDGRMQVQMAIEDAKSSGDESLLKKVVGTALASYPSVRAAFGPPVTGMSSEFAGYIADPLEQKMLKSKLLQNVLSGRENPIEAAKFVQHLNGNTPFTYVPKSLRTSIKPEKQPTPEW